MLRILPCYAVRWKKRLKPARPVAWRVLKSPVATTLILAVSGVFLIGGAFAGGGTPSPTPKTARPPINKQPVKDPQPDSPLTAAERGRILFIRQWAVNDEKTPWGDGIGPMFNARSCVACHNQGGVGGSGSIERNVDLLSLRTPL